MRPIDADELLEHVYRDRLDSRELIAAMINNAPTVVKETSVRPLHFIITSEGVTYFDGAFHLPSYQPITGHWILHDKHRECSRCRVWLPKDMPRNSYCPNCGRKMEGEMSV